MEHRSGGSGTHDTKRLARAAARILGIVVVAATVVAAGLMTMAPDSAAATSQDCSFANPGSGEFARTLCWIDMSTYNPVEAASSSGQGFITDLPGGYTLSYALHSSGGAVSPSVLPTFSKSFLGTQVYTGVSGRPALYQTSFGTASTLDMSDIVVRDPQGRQVTGFAIVGADAEETDINETFSWTSNRDLVLRSALGNACDGGFTGAGTTSVTCTGAGTEIKDGSPILSADDPSTLSQTMESKNGLQAAAFGILLSSVQLNKVVASRVDPADAFTLNVTSNEGSVLATASTGTDTSATTGEVPSIGSVAGAPVTLSEDTSPSISDNYQASWACTQTGPSGGALPSGDVGPTATVTPAIGELIDCTITNTALMGALTLQKIAGVPTDNNNDGLVDAGDSIHYTFEVTNSGELTIQNIEVSDPQIGAVTCPDSTLAPGQSQTCSAVDDYVFTDADVASGSFVNTATAQGNPAGTTAVIESNTSSTETRLTAPAPALTVVKSADPSRISAAGDRIAYSFLVTNTGNVPLTAVGVAETAFSGTGTAPAISCPETTLPAGSQLTCTAEYTATQADLDAGSISNTAVATGTPASGTPVSSPPSTAVVDAPPEPALTVDKSASPSDAADFTLGRELTYSFVATNTGNVTLTGIQVEEQSFTGSGTPPVAHCPAGSLAPGDQVVCTATYTLTQTDIDTGEVTNTAIATGTPPTGPAVESPPSETTTPADQDPALSLTKTADPSDADAAGQAITYTFVATNTGNVTLTGVGIAESSFTGTGTPPAVDCPAGPISLLPGQTLTCTATYTLTVADANAGSVHNTAIASATNPAGGTIESAPASAVVSIAPLESLDLVKTATPLHLTGPDQTISYSFLVTNTGNVTVTGIGIDESAFSGSGSVSAIDCPAGAASLAPGDQVTCTATYETTQADVDAGFVSNTATATGTGPGGASVVSDPSTSRVPIVANPNLTIVKTASVSNVTAAGESVTYSYLVTNTGNVTMTGIAVEESGFSGTGAAPHPVCPAEAASLAPGADVTCTATYSPTQADVDRGSLVNTATASGLPPGSTTPFVSPPSSVTVTAQAAPDLTVVKTATPTFATGAGERISYSYLVTNTGNVTLSGVTVLEGDFTGSGGVPVVTCPAGASSLAPGATVTCTSAYLVTAADSAAGSFTNTATAEGTAPGATEPTTSESSSTTVTVTANVLPTPPEPPSSPGTGEPGAGGVLPEQQLAVTGSDVLLPASIAAMLGAAGAALVLLARRSRRRRGRS